MLFTYHSPISEMGRVTIVAEETKDGIDFSAARCSNEDNFMRRTGRKLAKARLLGGRHIKSLPIKNVNPLAFKLIAESLAIDVLFNSRFTDAYKDFD